MEEHGGMRAVVPDAVVYVNGQPVEIVDGAIRLDLIQAADRLAEAVRAWAGCERCSDTDICREDSIPILDALDSYRRLRETMNG